MKLVRVHFRSGRVQVWWFKKFGWRQQGTARVFDIEPSENAPSWINPDEVEYFVVEKDK